MDTLITENNLSAAISRISQTFGGESSIKNFADIDNAPERERGITINTSHQFWRGQIVHYARNGQPGHADYSKNMITGAAQMDGAILVVSAADGRNASDGDIFSTYGKTKLGSPIVVFLNKVDQVDDPTNWLDLVEWKFGFPQ